MEILSLRQNIVYEQLLKDLALLSDLEDNLRTENDPKRKIKLRDEIAELKENIETRSAELQDLQNKDSSHSPTPPRHESESASSPLLLTEIESIEQKTVPSGNRQKTGREQISQAVEALVRLVEHETSNNETAETEAIDDFYLLRIQLLVSTHLASTIPTSMLGTHEINRLYLDREKLRPTVSELTSLLRLLVHDYAGYTPGWYWFSNFDMGIIESVLLRFAFSDQEDSIRRQAFDLLAHAQILLLEKEKESISKTVISDSSSNVRKAALKYLGRIGEQEHLPIVYSAFANRERIVLYQAKVSKYLILARTESELALSELLGESELESQDLQMILKELDNRKSEISLSTLTKTLVHSKNEIKLFGIKELIARNELSIDDATKLKTENDDLIQISIFNFLIDKGVDIEPSEIAFKLPDYDSYFGRNTIFNSPSKSGEWEKILLAVYRRYDFNQLLKMSSWSEHIGFDAYRALAMDHFEVFGEKLRGDLQNNFALDAKEYYKKELKEWREINKQSETLFGNSTLFRGLGGVKREPEDSAKDSVERHRKYYLVAALAGLLTNGSPVDVEFGRRFLSHSDKDVRIEALKILRKWGNEIDIPELIKTVQDSDEFIQENAAEAALIITENRQAVAHQLLKTKDEVIVSIVIADVISRDGEQDDWGEFLKEYLYDENENVRTRVMAYFVLNYNNEKLTALLTEYLDEAVYYYDVVCCFDRFLYAPANVRTFYRHYIQNSFFGLLDD